MIKRRIEEEGNRVTDLHVWAVGPRLYSAVVGVATERAKPPEHYKRLLPQGLGIVHLVVEVHPARAADLPT